MKKIKVSHDRKNCIGCHSCVEICPQSWIIDENDGKSKLAGSLTKGKIESGEIFDCDLELNQIAAEACPMKIIRIEKNSKDARRSPLRLKPLQP